MLLVLFSCSAQASIAAEWKYSKAANELASGNYAQAQGLMQSILVDEPNRPDLLYDLGVASFKNKEYSQASAYFASAAQAEACPLPLQEQSYFNLGNASVELNQLSDAIVHYEKVLELNEKNEQAQHNLEVVKKMLEEQEKQKQQDQQDKEDQKDNQNKDKQDKQDKNSKDGQNGDNGDDGQDGEQDESKNDSSKKNDGKQDQESKQKNKDGKGDKPEQNKDRQDGSKEKQDKGDGKDKKDNPADKKGKQKSSDKQQSNSDDSSYAKASEDRQNKQVDAGGQKGDKDKKGDGAGAHPSSMQKEPDLAPEDQWILQVLSQRENDEKKTNKQLIRASIDKKLGGQHGQNCW